jgi:polyphenol oxidase
LSSVEVIRAASLSDFPHGFLGRRGGVSVGELAGLNVGYGSHDERAAIAANRELAIRAILPEAKLATVHQIHSAEVVYAAEPWGQNERPKADGIVTDKAGLLLGILTADCAPVLLADEDARVIGAAHAGWRGAFAGVTDSTIVAMERLGARRDRIHASIGPCIGQDSYEVDADFRARFLDQDPSNARFFETASDEHHMFDLSAYVAQRLIAFGVSAVEPLNLDTYGDPERFYSYRWATYQGKADYGRQLSAIAIPPFR